MHGTFGVTTDWHMLVILALLERRDRDRVRGVLALEVRADSSMPPYWTKSVTVQLVGA